MPDHLPAASSMQTGNDDQDLMALARQNPLLVVALGTGLGLLAGALLPKRAGGRLGRQAFSFAVAAAELGLALSKQARDRVEAGARGSIARLDEETAPMRKQVREGSRQARSKGLELAGEALRLASKLRK